MDGKGARIQGSVNSDGSWSASLPPGPWRVAVTVAGTALEVRPSTLQVSERSTSPVTLEVQPVPAVRGRLLRCDGSPIPDAEVSLQGSDAPRARSDTDGLFVIGPVRAGRYIAQVSPSSLPAGIEPPWWQSKAAAPLGNAHSIEAAVSSTVPEIHLGPATVVSGVALGRDRQPVRNGALSFRMRDKALPHPLGANFVLRTDSGGGFAGPLHPGEYEAWCFPGASSVGLVRPDPIRLVLDCGVTSQFLELTFDGGFGDGRATGVVVDSRGRPVAGVLLVMAKHVAGMTPQNRYYFPVKASSTSDRDGRVTVSGLPEGRHVVWSAHGAISQDSTRLFMDAQQEVVLDVGPTVAEFVWVVDSFVAGSVAGAVSGAAQAEQIYSVRLDMTRWALHRDVLSEPDGRFVFERLPPGDAVITVGAAEASPRTVTVSEGVRSEVELPNPDD
jgi:hypothetical protein